jgi:hypothetical protein
VVAAAAAAVVVVVVVVMSFVSGLFSLVLLLSTSGDPHRSCFKFQTAVLSVLRVMFHVQLFL